MKFKKTQKHKNTKTQKQLKYKKLNKLNKKQVGGLVLNDILDNDTSKIEFVRKLRSSTDKIFIINNYNDFKTNININIDSLEVNIADEIVNFITRNNVIEINITRTLFNMKDLIKILIASIKKVSLLKLFLTINDLITINEISTFVEFLKKNTTLQMLKFGKLNITTLPLILEALETNNGLISLDFSSEYFQPPEIKKIADTLKNNSRLIDLNLEKNYINDESLNYIGSALKTNTTLQTLNLGINSIKDYTTFLELIKDNKTLLDIKLGPFDIPLPIELLKLLENNRKRFIFNPPLENIMPIDLKKYQLLFEFLRKVYKFKEESNNIKPDNSVFKSLKENVKKLLGDKSIEGLSKFDLEAINLCDEDENMEKSYFLFKHNYERAVEGYKRLQLIPIVDVSKQPQITITNNNNNKTKTIEIVNTKKNDIVVLSLHGVYNELKMAEMPPNVRVCCLTPNKYSTCIIESLFIKYLTEPTVIDNFLKDPSCLDKEKIGKFFSQSVIYYEGQYYPDLQLSRRKFDSSEKKSEQVSGLKILDITNNQFIKFTLEVPDNLPDLPDLSTDEWRGSLSELLKYFEAPIYKDRQFTIFIISCRPVDENLKDLQIENKITFLEKTTQSINVLAQHHLCNDINTLNLDTCIALFNECKTPVSNIYINERHRIQYEQKIKNNINNRSSSFVKANWTDESKICFEKDTLNVFKKFGKEGQKCITIKDLKNKLKDDKIYFYYLFLILSSQNLLMQHISSNNIINSSMKNYNDLMMFIFDNNIEELFKNYLLFLNNSDKITKQFLLFFMLINKKKIMSIKKLVFNNYNIIDDSNLSFLNINLEDKSQFSLNELDLSNNKIYYFFSNTYNSLDFIKNLEEINLDNNNITEFPTKLLNLPKLRLISLKGNKIELSSIPQEEKLNFKNFVWKKSTLLPLNNKQPFFNGKKCF